MNAPAHIPKDAEAIHDFAWWAAERDRQGTAWHGILLSVLRTVGTIEPCPVCEREPCPSPSARAEITVDLPVPASWSGRRRDAALRGEVRPTSRPDTDNYIKAALDAINAIVVADDSLVV